MSETYLDPPAQKLLTELSAMKRYATYSSRQVEENKG